MLERIFLKPALLCAAAVTAGGLALAGAQLAPPFALYGSVTDEAGPVAEGMPVEAYIGDVLCGTGATEYTGDGAARVTIYFVQVASHEDRPGCGTPDAPVLVRIGGKDAQQTVPWQPRLVQFDITFGNVAPVAIPTFTSTPGKPTAAPTIPGGVTNATPESANVVAGDGDSDGFPLWVAILLVLGAVGLVGSGVGYAMSRTRDHDDDLFD